MEPAFYAIGLLTVIVCGSIILIGLLTLWGKYQLNYQHQKKRRVEAALPMQNAQPSARTIPQHDPFQDIRGYDD